MTTAQHDNHNVAFQTNSITAEDDKTSVYQSN